MRIKDVMSRQIIAVERSTTLRKLMKIFAAFHTFPLVPVIEKDKRLVGIVSFSNLIELFQPYRPQVLKTVPFLDEERVDIFQAELTEEMGDLIVVEDIMEPKFISIEEDAPVQEAYRMMKLHLQEQLPVVDKAGRLTGMVGVFDIVRAIFRQKGII